MKYVSLFSGIGGMDLGLDRAGWECVAQVEREPFCRSILRRHWPEVPKHDDVRTFPWWWSSAVRPRVDAVVGGFPCQPFSVSATGYRGGRRTGTGDSRWGWPWMRDAVAHVRPRWVVIENVPGLLNDPSDPFGAVLSDLAALGFDAEWGVVSACALGAPHTRERLFVVADAHGLGLPPADPPSSTAQQPRPGDRRRWAAEPQICRVADGPTGWVDRIRALGNAVVPDVAEHVGRLILNAEATSVDTLDTYPNLDKIEI